jgi:hypothetical protein
MNSAVGGACARELLVTAVTAATAPLHTTLSVCVCCYVECRLSDDLGTCAVYANHLRRYCLYGVVCR